MAFCTNCGNSIKDDAKFCEHCGSPNELYENRSVQTQVNEQVQNYSGEQAQNYSENSNETYATQQPEETLVPNIKQDTFAQQPILTEDTTKNQNSWQEQINSNEQVVKEEYRDNSVGSVDTVDKNEEKKHNKTALIVHIICTVIIAAIAVTAGVIYYFTQVNSRSNMITVPVIKVANAQEAATKLRATGFTVRVVQEPNRRKKGSFVSLKGVKSGTQVKSSTTVTVVESLGPGMPKDVVGKTLESITSEVKAMDLPVKVYEVAATSKPGTVVATYPLPGQAFEKSGDDDAMRIAVGVHSDKNVIPVDIFGRSKDEAKNKLANYGINNIEFKPRFSSRKLIGKIVASYPALGSEVTEENEKVTLYYGIDAKDTKNSLTTPLGTDSYSDLSPSTRIASNLGPMAGEWCTNSGKCIYLNEYYPDNNDHSYSKVLLEDHPMKIRSVAELPEETRINDNDLSLTNFSQDISATILFNSETPENDMMKNHLLSGDTGAAEFYEGHDLPSCGKVNNYEGSPNAFCVYGKYINPTDNPDQFEDGNYIGSYDDAGTGLVYRMQDFFVLIPVNAKLEQLEKSGYFRGTGKHTPDLNRPFILRRDPKLYSKTEIPIPDDREPGPDNDTSPFVPTKKHKAIPFAPAPDDDNAYYKVENPVNWSDLHNAKTL